MADCLFCKLVQNEIPSYTVFEDDDVRAFLDPFPCAPGHTLIIPKKHGRTVMDYSQDELGVFWVGVQKIITALTKVFHTEVFTIGANHGEPAGIHHYHIHIIPRTPDDGGTVIQSIVKKPLSEDLSVTHKKIKDILDSH